MPKNDEFEKLLEKWKDTPKAEYEVRPWGMFVKFATVCNGVVHKELIVKPMNRLSLQKHKLRDELWIVASPDIMVEVRSPNGPMETRFPVPITEEGALVKIFIPRGWWHRLTNIGANVGHVFEYSLGIFNEDDIVRAEDDFGRSAK